MSKPKNYKVVLVEPMKHPRIVEVGSALEDLQAIVGGYIELSYPFDAPVAIVCNEEGKINRLPLNRALRTPQGEIYDIIAGTFFVIGDDYDAGEFKSLTDEEAEKYKKFFYQPEMFAKLNDEIVAIPVDEDIE